MFHNGSTYDYVKKLAKLYDYQRASKIIWKSIWMFKGKNGKIYNFLRTY